MSPFSILPTSDAPPVTTLEPAADTATMDGTKRKAVTFPPGSTPPKQRKTDEATAGRAEPSDAQAEVSPETAMELKAAEQQQVDVIKVYKARVAEKKQQVRHLKSEVKMRDVKNDAAAKAALIQAKDDLINFVKSVVSAKQIVIEAKDEKIALLELEVRRLAAQQAARIRDRAVSGQPPRGSGQAGRSRRAARRRRREHEAALQPEPHATA